MGKIVFVTQDCVVGGGTSSLSSLYNHIKNEYNVEVFQLTRSGGANVSYSEVIRRATWFNDLYYSSCASQKGWRRIIALLVKIFSRMFPSVIKLSVRKFEREYNDATCIIAFGEGAAAHFVSNIRSIRKITWIHYDITYYPACKKDLQLYSRFDNIVCVSSNVAEGMKKMYPSLKDKIVGIHNLVDPTRVNRLSHETIKLSDEYLYDTPFTIISIGRICRVKRFHHIPQIASVMKQKGINFRWIIVGPANDIAELNKLQEYIVANNVSDCVAWIGPRTNPYSYLSRANLLVSTSETEACPMIFIESKILRVPIVSASMLTADEFIKNGTDGLIVPINQISEAIMSLIADPIMYDSFKRNADNQIQNENSLATFRSII